MRLIDADALMVQMVEGPYNCPGYCGCCDPDRDLKIDSKTAFGCSAIIHAPTIDAIPVELVEKRLDDMLKGSFSFEECGAIAALLNDNLK